jgi:serine/threonine-protein kinase HipA
VIAYELGAVPESLGELDFMLRSNATRVGNLDFRPEPDSPEPELCPPMFEQLDELMLAAAEIEQGQKVDPHHVHLLRQGTSMGGARPKCTVSLDNELWIAKFPAHGDKVDMPLVEYATFQLARACGLAVPETQIVEIAGRNVFLIQRFDREAAEDRWTRRGFISALSLMNWHERDHASWDYRSLAAEMRRYTHAEDMIELFRRMVFNILIRNTDDHPRNHGFLFDGIQVKLSPAYDLVPTFTLAGVGSDSYLAMGLGVHGRLATLENALSNCGQYGLSADSANEHVHDLVSNTRNWREVFSGCGVSNQIQQALVPTMDRSL